jgi:hypothetical protein
MRVEVMFEPEARNDLLTLLAARTADTGDAIGFGLIYLRDIVEQFERHRGLPSGARRVRMPDGHDWWWRYVNGVWVIYRLSDRKTWLFGGVVRTVRVIGFEPGPPPARTPR